MQSITACYGFVMYMRKTSRSGGLWLYLQRKEPDNVMNTYCIRYRPVMPSPWASAVAMASSTDKAVWSVLPDLIRLTPCFPHPRTFPRGRIPEQLRKPSVSERRAYGLRPYGTWHTPVHTGTGNGAPSFYNKLNLPANRTGNARTPSSAHYWPGGFCCPKVSAHAAAALAACRTHGRKQAACLRLTGTAAGARVRRNAPDPSAARRAARPARPTKEQ